MRRSIKDTLFLRRRDLTPTQLSAIAEAAQSGGQNPAALLVAMLAGIGASWSCVDPAPEVARLPTSIEAAYRYNVAHVAHYHGRGLTFLALSLIALRPFGDGVSEKEMLDALSLDDELLERVY